ncbi:MAG: hypothetical protein JETT_1339 [Candidatus Jettenia ecosi]|uniref:Uncharacterized protein n=1 Tax=Candidatus Jettenia ecosi TaxID=2494326 RepID=A0A533QC43_9BACT|nr:MAG: hypothetical protein JETT_1339 [Candidatus Jettenia ecosi]
MYSHGTHIAYYHFYNDIKFSHFGKEVRIMRKLEKAQKIQSTI